MDKKAYVVHVDELFEGFDNFSTRNIDYEIKDDDLAFLAKSKLKVSPDDFEKAIDAFEKISKIKNNYSI